MLQSSPGITANSAVSCSERSDQMGFLTDYADAYIEKDGYRYKLDLAYDTVLNVKRMFQEKLLDDADMLVEALHIFGLSDREIGRLNWKDRMDLLEQIHKEKLVGKQRPRVGKQQILFDFEEDGEYIYASFMQAYGIDLIDQQGNLPWHRFIALFQGLPEKTKIKEIMRIRGMELPAPTKTNRKEIQNLMELKAYYALPVKGRGGHAGLDALFSALEQAAT